MSLRTVHHAPQREAGLQRLDAFLPMAGRHYAENRNFDLGPGDRGNVSSLSPWIRHRVLTETEILSAVIARHGAKDADKFIQEVLWRGYFKGWLEHRPGIWSAYRDGVAAALKTLERQGGMRRDYEAAIAGQTGVDAFDAWRDELVGSGWLHNHARMWFASIWIFTLRLPWQLGADFFLRHLIDGDPASNTLSWRWVGGLHTRGKTYLATAENIARFTRGRYNPEGQLSDTAAPLAEPDLPDPALPPLAPLALPDGDYALVLSEEDFDLDIAANRPPSAVLILPATGARSPLDVSEAVEAFDAGLCEDIAARARSRWGVPVLHVEDRVPAGDIHDRIHDWLSDNGLGRMAMAAIPQGPACDRWQGVLDGLAGTVDLATGHRGYDIALWPHAAKGFFRVKKAAPDILAAAGL